MPLWWSSLYAWQVRRRRGTIDHPTFGRLTLTHCIPHINLYWWTSQVTFPPTGKPVILALHSPPTGPSRVQEAAYKKLVSWYPQLLTEAAADEMYPTGLAECRLDRIELILDGQMTLEFYDGAGAHRVYTTADAEFISSDETSQPRASYTVPEPVGFPSHCPLCGAETAREFSEPPGDAPCPQCGYLLWKATQQLASLQERFSQLLGVPPESITADTDMSTLVGPQLGADSLDSVELLMELEEELDFHPSEPEREEIKTIGDWIRYVQRRQA
jgi:acyl carrier protein